MHYGSHTDFLCITGLIQIFCALRVSYRFFVHYGSHTDFLCITGLIQIFCALRVSYSFFVHYGSHTDFLCMGLIQIFCALRVSYRFFVRERLSLYIHHKWSEKLFLGEGNFCWREKLPGLPSFSMKPLPLRRHNTRMCQFRYLTYKLKLHYVIVNFKMIRI